MKEKIKRLLLVSKGFVYAGLATLAFFVLATLANLNWNPIVAFIAVGVPLCLAIWIIEKISPTKFEQ